MSSGEETRLWKSLCDNVKKAHMKWVSERDAILGNFTCDAMIRNKIGRPDHMAIGKSEGYLKEYCALLSKVHEKLFMTDEFIQAMFKIDSGGDIGGDPDYSGTMEFLTSLFEENIRYIDALNPKMIEKSDYINARYWKNLQKGPHTNQDGILRGDTVVVKYYNGLLDSLGKSVVDFHARVVYFVNEYVRELCRGYGRNDFCDFMVRFETTLDSFPLTKAYTYFSFNEVDNEIDISVIGDTIRDIVNR